MKNEYTNATTGAIVGAESKKRDTELLELLGIKTDIFEELSVPGDVVGNFSDEVKAELGFDSTVIFCPSHDTASAVAACPVGDNGVYISSGTWQDLMIYQMFFQPISNLLRQSYSMCLFRY